MARRPISVTVRDGSGNVLSGATVALTLYDGTVATSYTAYSGGSAIAGSSTTSGIDGTAVFWVDDADHPVLTVFTITTLKTGYSTQTKYKAA